MKIQDNSITLIDFAGGDASFCLSAWQSTGLELNIDLNKLPAKDRIPVLFEATQKMKQKTAKELLKMLLSEGHHTPFEKSYLQFSVTAEIASHIHFLKHRIGVSINSESARYKELNEDKAYIPKDFSSENKERLWRHIEESFKLYHYLIKSQTAFLIEQGQSPADARKRAKESARFCLPYAMQLNFDVAFNMRSFFHFLHLRNSSKAQLEIREIAGEMLDVVKTETEGAFDLTLAIFDEISRKAL